MTTTPLEALARLQAALDTLARALATGDSRQVLAAEEPVASAVSALAPYRTSHVPAADGDRLRRAIVDVQATLARCEALGRTAVAFVDALFPQAVYGRHRLHLLTAPRPERATPAS